MPITGDLTQNKSYETTATVVHLPVVAAAAIADAADPINLKHLSGKEKGAMIIVEESDSTLSTYIATGDAATDDWQRGDRDDTDSVVTVTPA